MLTICSVASKKQSDCKFRDTTRIHLFPTISHRAIATSIAFEHGAMQWHQQGLPQGDQHGQSGSLHFEPDRCRSRWDKSQREQQGRGWRSWPWWFVWGREGSEATQLHSLHHWHPEHSLCTLHWIGSAGCLQSMAQQMQNKPHDRETLQLLQPNRDWATICHQKSVQFRCQRSRGQAYSVQGGWSSSDWTQMSPPCGCGHSSKNSQTPWNCLPWTSGPRIATCQIPQGSLRSNPIPRSVDRCLRTPQVCRIGCLGRSSPAYSQPVSMSGDWVQWTFLWPAFPTSFCWP